MRRQGAGFFVVNVVGGAVLVVATLVAAAGAGPDEQTCAVPKARWEHAPRAGVPLPRGDHGALRGSDAGGASSGAEPACPEGIDRGWWGTVQRDIAADVAASEYQIVWQEDAGAYQSAHRAQNLRFTYWADGFAAEPTARDEASPAWKLGVRLAAWGRDDAVQAFHAGELRVDGNRAEAEGKGVTVRYRNDHEGMRQDFLVRERPSGSGPLRLWLTARFEGVAAEVACDGREVAFRRAMPGGARVMRYGDVKVTDARGRVLEAAMAHEGEGFAIVVDDAAAAYPVLVDPLSSSPDWTACGEVTSSHFGYSVASAGDVNGDGYSDVIVGAKQYSSSTGKAYAYLGSATGLPATASWTATGEGAGDCFGVSVASAGDVNGDGYADVVVGADQYSSSRGKAYVYLGSATGLAATASWTATGEGTNNAFGVWVASAGDVNGDGYADVIVGASLVGKAYVYLGSATGLAATASWTASEGGGFGYSVAGAGDVNGDGYADVVVGAPVYASMTGKAYVYLGSATGLAATASWTATGEGTSHRYGISVASAGDVNGDGYADVVVGADQYSSFRGKAYVYLGSATGLAATASWTASGESSGNYFGRCVASAGDVDGDGYADVVVGADQYSSFRGKAYAYLGSATGLSATASWTATGEGAGDYFGTSVASAGDVNGDGYSDVVVGAYNNASSTGKAYAYLGSATGLSATASWTATGDGAGDRFGASVASAGDVNGDGYSDVVVGAWGNASSTGKAYAYLGSATGLSAAASWTATGEGAGDRFGASVTSAGDVNGDGYADVIVGAWGNASSTGKAYVYLGSATGLSATASWTATGEVAGDRFGASVASAGDVNGDGYADLVIGAYGNASFAGKAYVYLGSVTGPLATPTWSAIGEGTYNYFGHSVASAGDVNGDGYADVVVGAYRNAADTGKAYVYLGSATGLSAAASWTGTGEGTDDNFGYSVASAGDVNGDGYADVVVGANGIADNTGKAYVYLGSATGLATTPSWTATGEGTDVYFGSCVASAGDVNGGGYADVVIGAYRNAADRGKAYVYKGNATGLAAAASWTATGEAAGDLFGCSAATTCDLNGDGYGDIVVGASGNASSTGKLYVYGGNDGHCLDVLPRQWRADLATPVVPVLKSGSQTEVGLGLRGRTFRGRSDVRVQFEVKPLGTPFDGAGLVTTDWVDPDTSAPMVNRVIGGLSNGTRYAWRARLGYRLSDGAVQPYSRWIYPPYNGGLGEADFQAGDYAPPEAPPLHITMLGPTQCRLWWNPVAGALSYKLYRGTAAHFTPGTPWQTVAAPDTTLDFSEGVGDPATTYYFLGRSLSTTGESGDSPRVGEQEFALP